MIQPGALETCDGFDSDCDTYIDQWCDRYCDTPVLTLGQPTLALSSEFPENTNGGDIALLPDGFLACGSNYSYDPNTIDQLERTVVRRFDRLGQPRGPSERVGRPIDSTLDEEFCRIAVGGDRAFVTWRQDFPSPDGQLKYYGRQLDLFGRPLGPVVELTGQTGTNSSAFYCVPVWNGESFGVFWAQSNSPNSLWLTTVPRWPLALEPTRVLVSNNLLGDRRSVGQNDVEWTGDSYLLAATAGKGTQPSMMTLRVDRNGIPFNSGYETPDHGDGGVALAPVGTRALMIWTERQLFSSLIWYQFVDTATGEPLSPGPRRLFASVPFNSEAELHAPIVTWTGEMFVVEVTAQYRYLANEIDHWLWRIRDDGTVLDPQGILMSGQGPRDEVTDLIWDGKELLYFFTMKSPRDLRRARVACSCGDLDHDGRNSCVDDCDDSNAQVAVTRPEICTGGLDDDCDGLVDCRDPNCSVGPGPAEVANVRWSGNSLTWNTPATATRYAVARGLMSDLVRRQDMIHADCPAYENVGTTWFDDGRKPPVGDALWYQVRAEAGPCRYGTWGVEPLRATIEACN
ncbi:MAG: putative metal-binding motif-containing protein [Acidobacteriota bacterium]